MSFAIYSSTELGKKCHSVFPICCADTLFTWFQLPLPAVNKLQTDSLDNDAQDFALSIFSLPTGSGQWTLPYVICTHEIEVTYQAVEQKFEQRKFGGPSQPLEDVIVRVSLPSFGLIWPASQCKANYPIFPTSHKWKESFCQQNCDEHPIKRRTVPKVV
jgi:hypothetical protein